MVNRSRYMILACQTGPTGGVSDPDAYSRTITRSSQEPVGYAINTWRGANIRGRVFGVQVCLNDGPGRLLTRRGNHQRGSFLETATERCLFDPGSWV